MKTETRESRDCDHTLPVESIQKNRPGDRGRSLCPRDEHEWDADSRGRDPKPVSHRDYSPLPSQHRPPKRRYRPYGVYSNGRSFSRGRSREHRPGNRGKSRCAYSNYQDEDDQGRQYDGSRYEGSNYRSSMLSSHRRCHDYSRDYSYSRSRSPRRGEYQKRNRIRERSLNRSYKRHSSLRSHSPARKKHRGRQWCSESSSGSSSSSSSSSYTSSDTDVHRMKGKDKRCKRSPKMNKKSKSKAKDKDVILDWASVLPVINACVRFFSELEFLAKRATEGTST